MNQRALAAVGIGFVIASSPATLQRIPYEFTYPLLAQAVMVFFGVLMILGGFFAPKADRYLIVLDFYMLAGVGLLPLGPVTNYPLGQEFWLTISFVTAVFAGLPAVLLLHLSSKNS